MVNALKIAVVLYFAIGLIVAVKTWEPEQGGWVWVMLLWPLQLAAKLLP